MVFDGPGAKLPTATLRPSALQPRRRMLAGDLDRWLSMRWEWLRPRAVPLLAALVGFFVTLAAAKYVSVYAYNDNLALEMRARITDGPLLPECSPASVGRPGREPIQFVIRPLKLGDRYLELTLAPPELR